MSTQVFRESSFLIPLYLIYIRVQTLLGIHLVGSWAGLVITYVSFSLPLSIWILTGFLLRLPSDLEEAAAIDGLTKSEPSSASFSRAASVRSCRSGSSPRSPRGANCLFASVLTTGPSETLRSALRCHRRNRSGHPRGTS